MVYSLYLNQLTYFLLFLSLFGNYYEGGIANKLSYQVNQQMVFCIFLFFILVRLPLGPKETYGVALHP